MNRKQQVVQETLDSITLHLTREYGIKPKTGNVKAIDLAYSGSFDFNRFVANISEPKAMLLFTILFKRLGMGLIKSDEGYLMAALEEDADKLFAFIEKYVPSMDLETVLQPK